MVNPKKDRKHSWLATVKRTVAEFRDDNLSDWAAALTYYGLLSLFPMLIALVSIVGLFADPQSTTQTVTDIVTRIGPESGAQTFSGPIHSITSNRGSAGVLFVVGLATALWSASGYIGTLHPRLQRDLRDRGGSAVLEAAPAAARGHPGDGDHGRRRFGGAGPHWPGGAGGRPIRSASATRR